MTPATAAKLREDIERYARNAVNTAAVLAGRVNAVRAAAGASGDVSTLEHDLAVSNLLMTARQLIGLVPVTSEVDHAAEWTRETVLPPKETR